MQPLTPEERKAAQENMDEALALYDSDGLVYPLVPTGDGELLRSMGPVHAPVWTPGENGLSDPIVRLEEFAYGRRPQNLGYAAGHLAVDNQTGQVRMFYDNPIYNLPLSQQFWLRQNNTVPPSMVSAEPSVSMSPRPVWGTSQGMVMQTNEGPTLLSNFEVHATVRRIIKQRGVPDAEEFQLEITYGSERRTMTIAASSLENVVSEITRSFPACHTDVDASKASARIANAIRDQVPSLPTVTVVKSPGFIRLGDQLVYAHDGARTNGPVEFRTSCTIPVDPKISQLDALRALLAVLKLAENSSLMLPLLLESHLGPLYNLFEAAGFAPRFVLFLHGQTGSLKTAVVQALFRLFKELPETPEATFRDTPTALEVKIGGACSRVLVVDDFQPPVTAAAGRDNLDKLEHLIRIFGDGIPKSRSNSELSRAKEFRPAGCCVVTGEDIGGSRSSLLRCLVLPVRKGEIDGKKLRFYQENPEYLYTHFFHFLEWAGANGDGIVAFIRQEFQHEREFFANAISEPRQADIGAALMLTARILLKYMRKVMLLNDSQSRSVEQRWARALVELLRHSEEETAELDPARMYIEAVLNMQATGRVEIAPSQAEFRRGHHIGFVKDSNWWVFPKEIFVLVGKYWREQGVIFPLKAEKVHALLHLQQLLDVNRENRKGREKILYTKKSTLEGRPRMLVLRVEQARAYIEKSEN